jgi:hypothetical protein
MYFNDLIGDWHDLTEQSRAPGAANQVDKRRSLTKHEHDHYVSAASCLSRYFEQDEDEKNYSYDCAHEWVLRCFEPGICNVVAPLWVYYR